MKMQFKRQKTDRKVLGEADDFLTFKSLSKDVDPHMYIISPSSKTEATRARNVGAKRKYVDVFLPRKLQRIVHLMP